MIGKRKVRVGVLMVALLAGPSMAQVDDAALDAEREAHAQQVHGAYLHEVANALGETGDAYGVALGSLLLRIAGLQHAAESDPSAVVESRIEEWQHRALTRAGDDVLANALLATIAEGGTQASGREASVRWAAAEPGNLAPLLFAGLAPAQLLEVSTDATRFDLHFHEHAREVAARLLAHPPSDEVRDALSEVEYDMSGGQVLDAEARAAVMASGIVAAFATPSLQPLMQACDINAEASAIADPRQHAACSRIATVLLAGSDTLLGEGVGRAMTRQLASSPREIAEVEAGARRDAWRRSQMMVATSAQADHGTAEFMRLLADPGIRTEQQLVERVIQDAGLSSVPPVGWQPPRPMQSP